MRLVHAAQQKNWISSRWITMRTPDSSCAAWQRFQLELIYLRLLKSTSHACYAGRQQLLFRFPPLNDAQSWSLTRAVSHKTVCIPAHRWLLYLTPYACCAAQRKFLFKFINGFQCGPLTNIVPQDNISVPAHAGLSGVNNGEINKGRWWNELQRDVPTLMKSNLY